MITVNELTKKYARTTAVDHISFDIQKGQIVGFLGPNGAGKTTTMRMLTCFMPPTSGNATVAGFDVLEEPMEVKKRIGYLPETPPLYPEMRTSEYLAFVGSLKGLSGTQLKERVDYVSERCAVADVREKLLGKLSKGYRQRVGLAQAIIHNPDVLILDEPTAGLDPKQRVIIISKGKLVATDSVKNLQKRASGEESIVMEIAGRNGALESSTVQTRLEKIPGVSKVLLRETKQARSLFEVETKKDHFVRGDLARAVVEAGWDLNELRPSAVSLEEIFLQLTGDQSAPAAKEKAEVVAQGASK
jgi:ABC-2 type transport system ATP-binding protein